MEGAFPLSPLHLKLLLCFLLAGWQFFPVMRVGALSESPLHFPHHPLQIAYMSWTTKPPTVFDIQRAIRQQEEVLRLLYPLDTEEEKNGEIVGGERKNRAGMQSVPKHQRERLYHPAAATESMLYKTTDRWVEKQVALSISPFSPNAVVALVECAHNTTSNKQHQTHIASSLWRVTTVCNERSAQRKQKLLSLSSFLEKLSYYQATQVCRCRNSSNTRQLISRQNCWT